jgi:hypothetical protein
MDAAMILKVLFMVFSWVGVAVTTDEIVYFRLSAAQMTGCVKAAPD